MSIDAFLKLLDYENFDYLYHETSLNSALNIMDKGLLIDGNNILQVDNILFTTTFFLSEDLTYDENEFIDFLESEKGIIPSGTYVVALAVIKLVFPQAEHLLRGSFPSKNSCDPQLEH